MAAEKATSAGSAELIATFIVDLFGSVIKLSGENRKEVCVVPVAEHH